MSTHALGRLALATMLSLWSLGAAQAQDFPNRQITILVGVAPGGITDITMRLYAEVVSRNVGQRIIIDNRPVAGGAVAATAVQNAPPDGYTLLTFPMSQFATLPAMQPVTYDPVKGFAPVSVLFNLPALLLVPANHPANSLAELLDYGKKKPGGLSFGSPGVGSPSHLLAANIGVATKTPIEFVQYRGGSQIVADLVTGRVDFVFSSYTAAGAQLDGKKLKALAIDASTRWSKLPDVPTIVELGYGKARVASWFGLAAPAATPPAVIRKLNEEFVKASRAPDLVKRLHDNGTLIQTSTPEEAKAMLAAEVKNIAEVVRALGLQQK